MDNPNSEAPFHDCTRDRVYRNRISVKPLEWRSVSEYVRWRSFRRPIPGSQARVKRRLALIVHPNKSILNAPTPDDYHVVPRRFTPDGRQLVGTALELKHILVYRYNGAGCGETLIKEGNHENLFAKYFTLQWAVPIPIAQQPIQVHSVLITHDSRFLLVMIRMQCDSAPPFLDENRLNESVPLAGICEYQNWQMIVINLQTGKQRGMLSFPHHVLYAPTAQPHLTCQLYNYVLMVYSVPQQFIQFYHLAYDGDIVQGLRIGRFCQRRDEVLFNQCFPKDRATSSDDTRTSSGWSNHSDLPVDDNAYVGLKQKLLAYLFHKAHAEQNVSNFHSNYNYYKDLRIARCQLLCERLLLIRLELVQAVWRSTAWHHRALLALYDVVDGKLVNVFKPSSNVAVKLVEQFPRLLDGYHGDVLSAHVSRLNTKVMTLLRQKSVSEVGEVIENALPLSLSHSSSSPYADNTLFSCSTMLDSTWHWHPHCCTIYYNSKSDGKLKFSLEVVAADENCECLLTIFHPTEPFAITLAMVTFKENPVMALHVRFSDTRL